MSCVPGAGRWMQFRVVPHRHQDGCSDPGCGGCLRCPEDHCWTCGREHAEDTCPGCLALARDHLAAIAELHGHLWEEAMRGHRATRIHEAVPGGDAVVMLVPGPTTRTYREVLASRVEADLDVSHTSEENRADPRPPLTVLLSWEERWHHHTGRARSIRSRDMEAVTFYLDRELHHMARHPLFPRLVKDLARTRRRLEDVLYDGVRPNMTRVPCLSCGTRLVMLYADTEPEDYWQCPRCGDHYDKGRYDRAKHHHLHSAGADRFVPISVAVGTIGRPEQTVRTWIRSGRVEVMRDATTGRLLVWWPDVRSLHVQTSERKRRGA